MAAVDLRDRRSDRAAQGAPCGSQEWRVVRIGADIGLVCEGCGHRILMDRLDVERRFTGHLERGPQAEPEPMAHLELPTRPADRARLRDRLPEPLVRAPVGGPGAQPARRQHGARRAHGDRGAGDRLEHGQRGADPDLPAPGGRLQRVRRRPRRAQRRAPDHARLQPAAGRRDDPLPAGREPTSR